MIDCLSLLQSYSDADNAVISSIILGLPDPPVNVQVEQGPQDGTLLVTWLPVPTNPASTLISPVIGYAVFAAGKKVAEIDSPTGMYEDALKICISIN